MKTALLKTRLMDAQDALASALNSGTFEMLPELTANRLGDIEELARRASESLDVKQWAKQYLERDRKLLEAAMRSRDQVANKLSNVQQKKTAQIAYLKSSLLE